MITLLEEILDIEGFIKEKCTAVDGELVYIRPLYIELIYMYPEITNKLVNNIAQEISAMDAQIIFAIEASVLPIAALVADKLHIPLSIIRKPRNFFHEPDEPTVFGGDILCSSKAVLLDDAIWSGYTINHVFDMLNNNNIPLPDCYFIFDFYDFNKGGAKIAPQYNDVIAQRRSWSTYRQVLDLAFEKRLVTAQAYERTLSLFNNI